MDEFESMEGYQSQEEFEHLERYKSQMNDYAYGQTEYTGTYTEGSYQSEPESQPQMGWEQPYGAAAPQEPKRKGGRKVLKFLALALAFGLVAGGAFAGTTYFVGRLTKGDVPSEEEVPSGANLTIADGTESIDSIASRAEGVKEPLAAGGAVDVSQIVEQSMPSIVSITTIARMQVPSFFFGRTQEYESEECGSGIIVSQDEEYLYIATNNHVVSGAQTLTVLFADDETVDGQIKGADASSDLAVVAVALEDIAEETRQAIRVATFGDSSELKIGQTAIAIGNALGYGQSVTTGVISALDREVTVTNETDGSTTTNALVQTSAAINPGNSGGALLNASGEVIGITSVKYAETSVEGMGYAIPVQTAIPIIKQLITRELVTGPESAYLGISGVDVTPEESETYHIPQGVYVARVVEGSGAANAGLIQGDIITRFDGRNVKSMDEVQELMQYLPAGTEVEVTILRAQNGEYIEQTLEITLGSKK